MRLRSNQAIAVSCVQAAARWASPLHNTSTETGIWRAKSLREDAVKHTLRRLQRSQNAQKLARQKLASGKRLKSHWSKGTRTAHNESKLTCEKTQSSTLSDVYREVLDSRRCYHKVGWLRCGFRVQFKSLSHLARVCTVSLTAVRPPAVLTTSQENRHAALLIRTE